MSCLRKKLVEVPPSNDFFVLKTELIFSSCFKPLFPFVLRIKSIFSLQMLYQALSCTTSWLGISLLNAHRLPIT